MSVCNVAAVESDAIVYSVGDTLPAPQVTLLGEDGKAADVGGVTAVVMAFTDVKPESTEDPVYTPVTFNITGVREGESATWNFTLPANVTDDPVRWRRRVKITEGGGTYTIPVAPSAVVEFSDLWGDPASVAQMTDDEFSYSRIAGAILMAEDAVRAWVTRPILSPVSVRVATAVELLAARALTTSPAGASITSETMGDYTVRFARTSPSGLQITDDIAELLAPWRLGAYSIYVGPDHPQETLLTTTEIVLP